MRKVPFVDLKKMHALIHGALCAAASRVIESAHYIGGEELQGFESEMARWLGVADVCGVSCATMGLYAALKCLNIGPGYEVITTVHTAIATSEAVTMTGAQVVFCDIEPEYYTLNPAEVEKKITDKTRAIIPVHLYGQPAEMDAVLSLARQHKLFVIEDCAQAQGARYNGQKVGTFGDVGVFSFFPSKTLGGFGDGGAVTARDPELARRMRMFSNHGRQSKYTHEFEGTNSRLDSIQAALLRVCLPYLDNWNEQRRAVAGWYNDGLAGIKQVVRPQVRPKAEHAYHLYVILVPDREALRSFLSQRGVETGVHYPYSLNVLPAYAHLGQGRGSFPKAEYACEHMLSLPIFPSLTREEVMEVCSHIREFLAGQSGTVV